MNVWRIIVVILLSGLLLSAVAVFLRYDVPVVQGNTYFGDLNVGGTLYVAGTTDIRGNAYNSGGTFTIADNVLVTGTLGVSGPVTFSSAARITGNFTAASFAIFASQTIVPSGTNPITPTASVVNLAPTVLSTPTIAACSMSGMLLVLYNLTNHNVVLQDMGNWELVADLTVGRNDVVQLMCVDGRWMQIAPLVDN